MPSGGNSASPMRRCSSWRTLRCGSRRIIRSMPARHADGHRMGQGRLRRQALYHSGAARDGGLAALAGRLRNLRAEGARRPSSSPAARSAKRSPAGRTRRIASARDLAAFKPGEILVAPATSPDWEPVMKIAAGVITDTGRPDLPCRHRGPRTRHSRRGRGDARDREAQDRDERHDLLRRRRHWQRLSGNGCFRRDANAASSELKQPRTAIMVNVGNPEMAFRVAMQPQPGRRARPHGVHHQRAYRRAPDGAAQAGEDRNRQGQGRDRPSGCRLQEPVRFLHREAGGRRRHHCRGILSQAGDRAAFRLQDQRICQPARRRGVRAQGRQSDARISRRLALQPSGLRGRIRAGMRGAPPGAREDGSYQSAHHGAVLPDRRGRPARDRDDGEPTG